MVMDVFAYGFLGHLSQESVKTSSVCCEAGRGQGVSGGFAKGFCFMVVEEWGIGLVGLMVDVSAEPTVEELEPGPW
jgi:hypothetical protein